MKNYVIAFVLLLPLLLIFNGGALIHNFVALVYAFILRKAAHTNKGKNFVNELYNYTEFLTDKYLRKYYLDSGCFTEDLTFTAEEISLKQR